MACLGRADDGPQIVEGPREEDGGKVLDIADLILEGAHGRRGTTLAARHSAPVKRAGHSSSTLDWPPYQLSAGFRRPYKRPGEARP